MTPAKQIKVGMAIIFKGELWRVLQTQIIAPGNWRAFVQTKLRHITKGTQTEHRFGADENVERAILDKRAVEFLYQEGESYHFMDTETYEQTHLTNELLADAVRFLTPNLKLLIEFYDGKPIGIELPQTVKLKVVETEPSVKTATVTNSYKLAKVETGTTIQVPGFITEGEMVEVDTATGEYIGRAK